MRFKSWMENDDLESFYRDNEPKALADPETKRSGNWWGRGRSTREAKSTTSSESSTIGMVTQTSTQGSLGK